jgi:S-DNA-T family DNA segregation ATPase FtsK/SpoIIIE
VELGLGLHVPATGARADVVVRGSDGARLDEVAPLLLARVLPPGRGGELSVAGRPVPGSALLGEPPLLQGAMLDVDGVRGQDLPADLLALRVVGGPAAGAVHRLTPGELVLGRDDTAGVRVDDPGVSRRHCVLRIGHDGATVTDLGSTNGTTVDGTPVAAATGSPLAPGAVLQIGATTLLLAAGAPPAAPLQPIGDGRLAFNRPPRLLPTRPRVRIVVPAPPAAPERAPLPLLAIVAPLLLGVAMWRWTGSTTFLLFTLLSPVMVVGSVVSDRRTGRRRSRREMTRWREQREMAERAVGAAVRADEQARRTACPDAAEALLTALRPLPRLWERRRDDPDLLDVRLGLADQPAQVEAEGSLPVGATTARAVPVVVPLGEVGVLGIAGPRESARALARWALVQSTVWHSPRDLQVVVLADAGASSCWDWARWLPHARPDAGQDCHTLLGLGPEQVATRVAELSALVEARRADHLVTPREGNGLSRLVLVVVDGARALRAVPGLAGLLAHGPGVGVVAVCLDDDLGLLPEECGAIAVVDGASRLTVTRPGTVGVADGSADLVTDGWAEHVARALAPLHDETPDRGSAAHLPESVRWTDLVDLPLEADAEDAARVVERWAAHGRSTTAVLGRTADGLLAVDLRRDGPHALVAGTTGSGKSELLQTLLASLALGNRPDELTFVLVDYKGGAAFGPCEGLPHTVGLVTDLDGPLVERALASLRAELSRREAVLREAGAKDVDEHRRLVASRLVPHDVLPRLVLVVDEFASLVEELPDFVGGLVDIAMRGRSLGVHLVLATQRPEGVVSADIRANTNLRLCLAVTRDGESRDVLDAPDAVRISRRTPGRGYVRTGHAELTAFQAARVGGRRTPASAPHRPPSVELLPAAELGDPVPHPGPCAGEPEQATDLSLLVAACGEAAERLGIALPQRPWLPPLPDRVVLSALDPGPDALVGTPGRVPPLPYALVDAPAEQTRRVLTLDLDRSTHLLVVGCARSGRTATLRALAGAVAATACPDDVHVYALDLGGGGLACVGALPHTGAVVGHDQPERIDRLLTWLGAEVGRRQAVLSAGGHHDLTEQRAASAPRERLPHLLLLLDRWEAFLAGFQDVDAGRLVDLVHGLLGEGPSVGLHVVLTADRSGLVGRLSSLVESKVLLRLADESDYAAAGLPARLVPDALPPGRGWDLSSSPLVAQVALLAEEPSGPAQSAALTRLAAAAPSPAWHRPRRVELLPALVHATELPPPHGTPTRVVLGVGGDELDPVTVDLAETSGWLVAGPPGSGRSSALVLLADQLRRTGRPLVAVAPRRSPVRELPGLASCVTDPADGASLTALLAGDPCVLLVDDADVLTDTCVGAVLDTAVRDARDAGTLVLAAGATDELVLGYRGFAVDLRKARTGLLLAPQGPADGDLLGVRLSRAVGGDAQPGRGLVVQRGRVTPVQVALPARRI